MKKFFTLMAVTAVVTFTSCSNEDIEISKAVNITVNPATVVSTFSVGEEKAGDLESFDTDCKLNVKLFIYNEEGNLIQKYSNTFSNYAVQMKVPAFLANGSYTAVAITHIDDVVDNVYYWKIEGEQKLEGMRIVDGGYIGGQNKVLGVAVKKFTVSDDVLDLNIDVKPAGAMLTVRYYNFLALRSQGYTCFTLLGNKSMEYLEFDRSGKTNVVADNHNGEFDWRFDIFETKDYPSSSSYSYVYNYEFILSMTNVGLKFVTEDNDSYYNLGNSNTFNIEAGNCYYAYLRLNSKISSTTASFGRY